MSKTNTLTSHTPERRTNRADKMSSDRNWLKQCIGYSKTFMKKFASKKRRQLLKDTDTEKI